ncbi:MAG: hypothetical protein ACI89J_001844, partial [Hyphomicrobiaceae bacterium]
MRKYLEIDLSTQSIETRELQGREIINSGRRLIAETLLNDNIAGV